MALKVSLDHRTAYHYDQEVTLGPQTIQLRPTPHCRTPILSYALTLDPAEHTLRWQMDPHSNFAARVMFAGPTRQFVVDVHLLADLSPFNPFDFVLEPGVQTWPFRYSPELERDLEPYRAINTLSARLRAFVATIPQQVQSTVNLIVTTNQRVRDAVAYTTRWEPGTQSAEETLLCATGSCRDSGWLLVEVFRHLGIAARFVSGYLIQLAAEEGAPGPTRDSADLHAWCEVFLPGAGWIGLDPTSGMLASEGHIPLVCTPTAAQAAPIAGTVSPAGVEFTHTMRVRRLDGAVQVTRPYTDEQWQQVRGVAHRVDAMLQAEQVRLTMGGEPTFVGRDEAESLQWSLEALGPLKRSLGLALIRDLRERTAPGGLLYLGQGKWYPGEVLPRWAFQCISRRDGVAVWEDLHRIALDGVAYGYQADDARRFIEALSRRLQVSGESILPAYDVPTTTGKTDEAAGYVLPLRRRQPDGVLAWSSQLWFPRPERLVLSLGDSPIGYRIPVDVVPFVAPDDLTHELEEAGDATLVKLPAAPPRRPELFACVPLPDPLPPLSSTAETATELIRPALCVQVRDGRMHVFLPYVPVLSDYLDLVAAVEDTCRYTGMNLWIEGYTPPFDPRLVIFGLTPDPGVLEVNLPPAADWDTLETTNRILHEEADKHRLIASKFAYDGSHLATGGGSHIVLGGITVPDSPLLRRPDLLRSMVAFWQNHPSLSYLFSGMYVGPTSQYPRVDEARVDALYELEVAFSQLPLHDCPPYILDGLFRNLLVDVTGNAHRAEFCIDKLYPPSGLGLQAGLLELRAFEMAPHYRMGLLQMLLVRALVAVLWKSPFVGSLVRWGTALHDRYMLPYFVQQDFGEVLRFLTQAGIALQQEWFAAHVEFRFPRIGTVTSNGVELELRQALEPWNVLAEETTSGRTGRSVDSSLERMQVKVSGLQAEGRYVVACNGRRVPLTATPTTGEAVAGVRYRARMLSAALHPTVPVHTPLTFDLIDTWSERSVARCTYFAGPPDGSVHTTKPTSATEARQRREERFVQQTPPTEPMHAPAAEGNTVFPSTLDLRWPAPVNTAEEPPR